MSSAAGGPQPYRITASARRPAPPEARITAARAAAAAITRWGHAPEHPTRAHLGLLVLPALAIELTAAARDPATGSCIGGVIPGNR